LVRAISAFSFQRNGIVGVRRILNTKILFHFIQVDFPQKRFVSFIYRTQVHFAVEARSGVFTVVLEGGRIGENLRCGRVQDLGLGNHIEKLGNGALKVEKEKGRGEGRAKDDEGIAENLLEGNHVVFVAEEAHLGEFGQTEKDRHGRG